MDFGEDDFARHLSSHQKTTVTGKATETDWVDVGKVQSSKMANACPLVAVSVDLVLWPAQPTRSGARVLQQLAEEEPVEVLAHCTIGRTQQQCQRAC
jgi:hypothetical protein